MDNFQNLDNFECVCEQLISSGNCQSIMDHISQCKLYQDNSPFYQAFSTIPLQKIPQLDLYIIKIELSYYVNQLEQEIQRRKPKNLNPQYQNEESKLPQSVNIITKKEEPLKYEGTQDLQDQAFIKEEEINNENIQKNEQKNDKNLIQEDQMQCIICKSHFSLNDIVFCECSDIICKGCIKNLIKNEFIKNDGKLKCPICKINFSQRDFIEALGKDQYDQMTNQLIKKQFKIVQCVKCQNEFEFQQGDINSIVQNKEGKALSKELKQHYANNRFICPNNLCRQEQCRSCQVTPYHFGYTCSEFADFQKAKKCRYCYRLIKGNNNKVEKALQDICNEKECQVKAKLACIKIKQCDHPCSGYKNEKQCPPCLFEECSLNNKNLLQKGSEFCNICFIESLINSPVVLAKCGHIFHYQCLEKSLQSKWITARIVFNFCHCPLCKKWLELPDDCPLQKDLDKFKKLFEDIKDKSMKRLQFEERLKDEKLINPQSPFYKKPLEYSIAIYSYYMCYKCTNPYFGGLKDCERMLDEKKEFNPKELICPNCCQIPFKNCPKHGVDYIEFKCKYCCTIAQWFCFGTTHFCEACHNKWQAVEEQRKKGKLPKCPGKKNCPLKIDHKQNGEECELGCALCRNFKESGKEF